MDPRTPSSPRPGQQPGQEPYAAQPAFPPVDITDRSPYVSPPSRSETLREILSTIGVLVAALLVAFGLIAWVFQSYEVDGPSMENTLNNRDRLIVWKVPRTMAKITGKAYIPHRGDIVIFNESGISQFGSSQTKQLIKRVIALPGERVVIKDGEITVFNTENPDGFNPDKTMSYGKRINEDVTVNDLDVRLARNQIFVSGDNRPNSLDSRTFGPIESEQIVGKLALRLLPVSQFERF